MLSPKWHKNLMIQNILQFMVSRASFTKMFSFQYMKSHCGDKGILQPSYIYNGISYT